MKSKIMGLLVGALFVMPMGVSASVITYDFTTTVGNGYFSYDDSNTTTVSGPASFAAGGVWYDALSFFFGGAAQASPLMGVYDNFAGNQDCLAVSTPAGRPALSICGTNLWSGTQLSNLNGWTEAVFLNNDIILDAGGTQGSLITLRQRVPEPGTLALLGLGLAGLGVSRRRKTN